MEEEDSGYVLLDLHADKEFRTRILREVFSANNPHFRAEGNRMIAERISHLVLNVTGS